MDPACLHTHTINCVNPPQTGGFCLLSIVCFVPFCSQVSWFSNFSFWLFGLCVRHYSLSVLVPTIGDFLFGADTVPGVCFQVSCVAMMDKLSWRQLPSLACQWGALGHSVSAPVQRFLNRNILMLQYMFLLSHVVILTIIVIWWSCQTIEKVRTKNLFTVLLFYFFLAFAVNTVLHPPSPHQCSFLCTVVGVKPESVFIMPEMKGRGSLRSLCFFKEISWLTCLLFSVLHD